MPLYLMKLKYTGESDPLYTIMTLLFLHAWFRVDLARTRIERKNQPHISYKKKLSVIGASYFT